MRQYIARAGKKDPANFNPRTPCGVRRSFSIHCSASYGISIHAPLAGCDGSRAGSCTRRTSFQSTHPLRGATGASAQKTAQITISIHAPLAGCDVRGYQQALPHDDFNPRTPCGVRPSTAKLSGFRRTFQSTHPLRGATKSRIMSRLKVQISIHAPLAGCDRATTRLPSWVSISIHAPLAGCDSGQA